MRLLTDYGYLSQIQVNLRANPDIGTLGMQALRIFEILEFPVFSDPSFAHRVARVSESKSEGANLIQTQKEEDFSYRPGYWRHFFKEVKDE